MQAPKRRRPLPRRVAESPDLSALAECAACVQYVGSPEHKSFPSFAGPPRLRADASKCPTHLKDPAAITDWLREAIKKGNVSGPGDAETFPRYAWAYVDNVWFEARLVNQEQGTYKGYPLEPHETPTGVTK